MCLMDDKNLLPSVYFSPLETKEGVLFWLCLVDNVWRAYNWRDNCKRGGRNLYGTFLLWKLSHYVSLISALFFLLLCSLSKSVSNHNIILAPCITEGMCIITHYVCMWEVWVLGCIAGRNSCHLFPLLMRVIRILTRSNASCTIKQEGFWAWQGD